MDYFTGHDDQNSDATLELLEGLDPNWGFGDITITVRSNELLRSIAGHQHEQFLVQSNSDGASSFNADMLYDWPGPLESTRPSELANAHPAYNELLNFETLLDIELPTMQGHMHDRSTAWQQPYQLEEFPSLMDGDMPQIPRQAAPAASAALEQTATAIGSTSKPFNCAVSGCNSKGFKRRYELERHMRKHNRPEIFPCPVTGCRFSGNTKAFYRRDKLQSHLRKAHPGRQAAGNGSPPAAAPVQGQAGSSV